MTRTAIYNASNNTLVEQPGMEKPELPELSYNSSLGFDAAMRIIDVTLSEYNAHLDALRAIPCHESAKGIWKDGDKLEEGKDYEVRPDLVLPTLLHDVPTTQQVAFPLPVKSEDDLYWYAIIALVRETRREAGATDVLVKILKENYSLTKR